jgi:hypothetical protein
MGNGKGADRTESSLVNQNGLDEGSFRQAHASCGIIETGKSTIIKDLGGMLLKDPRTFYYLRCPVHKVGSATIEAK